MLSYTVPPVMIKLASWWLSISSPYWTLVQHLSRLYSANQRFVLMSMVLCSAPLIIQCELLWKHSLIISDLHDDNIYPDNKIHGANIGPTWILSAPDGPHIGPMNLTIREVFASNAWYILELVPVCRMKGSRSLCNIFKMYIIGHNSQYMHHSASMS